MASFLQVYDFFSKMGRRLSGSGRNDSQVSPRLSFDGSGAGGSVSAGLARLHHPRDDKINLVQSVEEGDGKDCLLKEKKKPARNTRARRTRYAPLPNRSQHAMEAQAEEDLEKQRLFYDTVRETIISLLVFLGLYLLSYLVVARFQRHI